MIREIDRVGIIKKLSRQDGRVVFVEATRMESYEKAHLPGAVLIPSDQIARLAAEYFPNKGLEIIVYGEDKGDQAAARAAQDLVTAHYYNVYYYAGGKKDWIDSGLSTEAPIRPMASPQSWNVPDA